MWFVKLLLAGAFVYGLVLAAAFVFQGAMLFPASLVAPAGPLPPGARTLTFQAPDGVRLHGVHVPGKGDEESGTLILVFVGNASNAQGVAERLHDIYPAHDIAAFYYRGYAPSEGSPSAVQLMNDAPLIPDWVARALGPRRIVAVGISLGSGVAAALAARRPLDGLILVTPFDSLGAAARQLYPWLPVSWLLRHDMRSAEALRDSRVPVAIIAAGRDRLIRPERTEALRRAIPNLVYDGTVPGASHDGIFLLSEFPAMMRGALARVEAAAGA